MTTETYYIQNASDVIEGSTIKANIAEGESMDP